MKNIQSDDVYKQRLSIIQFLDIFEQRNNEL